MRQLHVRKLTCIPGCPGRRLPLVGNYLTSAGTSALFLRQPFDEYGNLRLVSASAL